MRSVARLAAGAGVATLVALSGGPALAQVCDPYSNGCVVPERPPVTTEVQPSRVTLDQGVAGATTPTTLLFTGGELVALSALGGVAVAGGVVLVVAGRRRAEAR
jgi:hypothetical protein